jgi:hypothetical protein
MKTSRINAAVVFFLLMLAVYLTVLKPVTATDFLSSANGAQGYLNHDIDSDDNTFALHTNQGLAFPAPPTDNDFRVVIGTEIMNVTARTSDVFTVDRGAESTTPDAHSEDDLVSLNVTAGYVQQIQTAVESLEGLVTDGKVDVPHGGTGAAILTGLLLGNGTDAVTAITNNSTNWDTGYTDRMKWDGGSTGLDASAGRTSLALSSTNDVGFNKIDVGGGYNEGEDGGSLLDDDGTIITNGLIFSRSYIWSKAALEAGINGVSAEPGKLILYEGTETGTSLSVDYTDFLHLNTLAGISKTANNFVTTDGTTFAPVNGTAARTAIGLGTGNTAEFNELHIGGGNGFSGASITSDGAIVADALIHAAGKLATAAGTSAAPSVYFYGDTDTGIYQSAANEVGVAIAGLQFLKCLRSSVVSELSIYDDLNQPYSAGVCLNKSRAGGRITSGDRLGGVVFRGHDGNVYQDSAYIFCYNDAAPGVGDMAGRVSVWTSPDGSASPAEALRVASNKLVTCYDDIYVTDNCSALSFTDRTPAYDGDALDDIAKIKADAHGDIDHSTLPAIARKKIKHFESTYETQTVDGKEQQVCTSNVEVEEDGRDLGAMVSVLTVAVQQLTERNNTQQTQIDDLLKRIEKLEKK